jgi:type II secretory pathway pseudopilin PulG
MRRGYTLMEALVAAVIGVVILSAITGIFITTRRMTQSGDLASALSSAAVAMEMLNRDLHHAVQKPDPATERIVVIDKEAGTFRFIRGGQTPAGVLTGEVVTYRREKTAGGHFRLVRTTASSASPLPGVYSDVDVRTFKAVGGPFVRVTLHVVARDAANSDPAKGADEAVLTSLIRVAPPEMIHSGMLRFKFMDELRKVELAK